MGGIELGRKETVGRVGAKVGRGRQARSKEEVGWRLTLD